MRAAFLKADKSKISDLNLLEFLLFYAIPRVDTKPIALRLMEKYGTLERVMNAPYEELVKVSGMGESSALLLSTLTTVFSRLDGSAGFVPLKVTQEEIVEKLSAIFKNKSKEVFALCCFDALESLTGIELIGEGTSNEVEIRKRQVLETAFKKGADSVIIAHNHPNEVAAPSREDILFTRELYSLFAQTDIKLLNHYIFGTDGFLSLKDTEIGLKLFSL